MMDYNVNIKRKEMPGNITDGVFNGLWLSNGDQDHIEVDLVKMMSISPVIESILREFDVPLFSLDGLLILMPETDADTLTVFKSLLSNCKTPMMDRKVYRNLEKLFQSLGFSSTIYSPLLIENGDQEEFEMMTEDEEEDWRKEIKKEYIVSKETVDSDNNNTSEDPDYNYYVRDNNDGDDDPGTEVGVKKELMDHLHEADEDDDEWLPKYKYQTPKHLVKKPNKTKKQRKSSSSSKGPAISRFRRCGKCENCVHNEGTPKCGNCGPCMNPRWHQMCRAKRVCIERKSN